MWSKTLRGLFWLPPVLMLNGSLQAAEPSSAAPIHFKADRSHADLGKGVTRLQGHVNINQGNTEIQADEATLIKKKGKLSVVRLKGKPARWHMQPEKGKPIQAEALTIRYLVQKDIIELSDEVVVVQGEDRLQGEYFQLNRKTGEMLGGDVDGGKGRVELVFPPPEDKPETADAPR